MLPRNDAKELKDPAPPSLFLTRKPRKNARELNIIQNHSILTMRINTSY